MSSLVATTSSETDPVLGLPRARWTLVEAVRLQAQRLGDAEFLDVGGERLTFAELDRRSDVLATALAGLGVEPGERVLALATNSIEFIVAMIATHKRRAIFTPVNTELVGSFLQNQVRNSEPVVLIVDAELIGAFAHVDTEGIGLRHSVVIDAGAGDDGANGDRGKGDSGNGGSGNGGSGNGDRGEGDSGNGGSGNGGGGNGGGGSPGSDRRRFDGGSVPDSLSRTAVITWDELIGSTVTDPAALLTPAPSDVCTIMYTSGTTGPSKGVLMPQAHCFLMAKGAAEAVGLRMGEDRYYVAMPFFHANALLMQVYACLLAGAPATVVKRFSVTTWLDQLIACGATATNALGVMPEFIFRQPPDPRDRAHRVTRIMAVPIAEEWGAAFEARFGVRLIQGYGMTEINMVAYSDPADPVIAGCAGRILEELFEVIVADPETDEPLPVGQSGEILVRPRHPFCFNAGYFRMADKTVEAYRNLWFHTGDAGRFDPDGRLHFIDRLKDRIRRRGENISSYEIEQVLNEHPAVLESAAVGIRVEGAGGEEEIKAVIALHDGQTVDPVALLDYCVERMPRYAVPRFVEIVGVLDKTPSGKVRKAALRDAGVTEATWDRESVGYQLRR